MIAQNARTSMILDQPARKALRLGWALLALFLLTIVLYVVVGKVSGAVVTSAVVRVDLHRRPVQHREGGTVERVLVKEGQRVEAGQLIAEMRDVAVDAGLDMVNDQLRTERIRLARLDAERVLATDVIYPKDILATATTDPVLQQIIDRENQVFKGKQETLAAQTTMLDQQAHEAQGQAVSFDAQAAALDRAHKLAQEELEINQKLYDQHFIQRTNLLAVQRAGEDLLSRAEEARANAAGAKRQVKQLQLQQSALVAQYRDTATLDHRESASKVAELEQRLRPSTDASERLKLHAPVSGRIVGLKVTSPGAIIAPGGTVMEIVADDDKLIFDAKVNPADVSQVVEGAQAEVRLAAMRFRRSPGILGKVTSISADAFTDDRSGQTYYSALVEVPYEELRKDKGVTIQPGMPADIYILTEERSIAWYLVEPITDYLRGALREQ